MATLHELAASGRHRVGNVTRRWRPGLPRFILSVILAALCASVLAARVTVNFERVRIPIVRAALFSSGGTIAVPLSRVADFSGQTVAIVARLRNGDQDPRIVRITLEGSELATVALAPARQVRLDLSVPAGLDEGDQLTLSSDGDGWALSYLELANVHGFSTGLLDFVIVPSSADRETSLPLLVPLVLFLALLVLHTTSVGLPRRRVARATYAVMATLVLAFLALVLVASWVSQYGLFLSMQTFMLCVGIVYYPALRQKSEALVWLVARNRVQLLRVIEAVPHRRLIGGVALVALSGAFHAALGLMGDERPAYVHVRWAPSVDPAVREWVERTHSLTDSEPMSQRTWAYSLTDVSTENIRRLVGNPAVEDTSAIDRDAFRIMPSASRGPYARRRAEAMDFAVRACLFAGAMLIALWALQAWRARRTAAMPPGAIAPMAPEPALVFGRRVDGTFLVILLAALLLRIFLATTAHYIHDEENTSIPLSKSISFSPSDLNLPLRGENHGALPAYLVKASSTLFGTTPLAYRSVHVFIGMCTIVMIYLLTNRAYGALAARWSASFMAFNEYFLSFSARATANTPYLFLMMTAVYVFSRFLATERAVYLYAAAVATGLAFYCKEHAVLLLPVFLLMLLGARYRRWLRGPHAYLAAAVFVLVIGPDLAWNLRVDPDAVHVTYSGGNVAQATYTAHLSRIGGIGLSPYPAMFYQYTPVRQLIRFMNDGEGPGPRGEYHPVNWAIGLVLVVAVLLTTVKSAPSDPGRRFLLLLAWGVFLFFTLIERGDPPYRLSPVNWVWVEVTLIPAVILTGARLAGLTGTWRVVAWVFSGVALMYAVDSVAWNSIE